ncbi:MAG: thiamine diphosphokinase [Treponema sp.]|nr:thiamine diphosphokinase [Treponema sp.]
MLGIIFTGGDGPPPQVARKLIKETSMDTIIIAADSGFLAADRAGFKPDWVIGDMDSLEEQAPDMAKRLDSWPKERIIRHVHDKDNTDSELAFSHAIEQNCDYIWIIGGGGGRIDHLFAIYSFFERDIFPQRWITNNEDIRCIEAKDIEAKGKAKNEVCCRLEKNAIVSLLPLGSGPWKVNSVGLKWPLDNLVWKRGFFWLSNEAVSGEFSIVAKEGRFMVILPIQED